MLRLEHGCPTVYRQFLANIIHSGLTETIFPLPMTSISAAELMAKFAIQADLRLHRWCARRIRSLRRPSAILAVGAPWRAMFGDDYATGFGVIKAVNRFAYEIALGLATSDEKWALVKP